MTIEELTASIPERVKQEEIEAVIFYEKELAQHGIAARVRWSVKSVKLSRASEGNWLLSIQGDIDAISYRLGDGSYMP